MSTKAISSLLTKVHNCSAYIPYTCQYRGSSSNKLLDGNVEIGRPKVNGEHISKSSLKFEKLDQRCVRFYFQCFSMN